MANEYIIQPKKINRAFQYSVELNLKKNVASAVLYNAVLVYKWIKKKYSKTYVLPYKIPPLLSKEKLDIIYKDKRHFCCRFEHPDSKFQGREWLTEVEIIALEEKVLLGIKVSYTTPENADYDRNIFSVPTIVWDILKQNGFSDIRELKQSILEADSEERLTELYDLIADKNRILPVIVITDLKDDAGTKPVISPEYLLNRVGIIAHVAHIPFEWCLSWKEKVGKDWDVYNGAVRIYYENLDFDADNFREHPLFMARQINEFEYTDDKDNITFGAEAFFEYLCNKIKTNDTRLRLDWRGRGHKFFNAARIALDNEFLKNKEEQIGNDWLKIYDEDIGELKAAFNKENADLLDELNSALEKIECLQGELNAANSANSYLKEYNDALLKRLADAEGKPVDIIPEEQDCNFEELPKWIMTHFPDTIVLLKSAEKSLEDADYENKRLLWQAVELLGTEYCKRKRGEENSFDEKCKELNLKEDRTTSDIGAGQVRGGSEYYVTYRGKKRKIDRHLKKGVSRKSRYCLRIYFFWDDSEGKVIIASLHGHFDTRDT